MHVRGVFAGPTARFLQHLILYPVLLGCVRASLRTGWRPAWTRVPLQVLLGVLFAVLAYPAMALALWLVGEHSTTLLHELSGPGQSVPLPLLSRWFFRHPDAHLVRHHHQLPPGLRLRARAPEGFAVYRRLRDAQTRSAALERALSTAHLASLRMQLSPHSLFNLLHTIHGQIDWDPAVARTMIVQLGDLLRRLLNAGEREYSRLADEMQFARLYLELQQRRFADRLTVAVPPPAALPAAWVPSLILQPLIENAVAHGLAGHQGPVSLRGDGERARAACSPCASPTRWLRERRRAGRWHRPAERARPARDPVCRAGLPSPPRRTGMASGSRRYACRCLADVLAPTPATIAEPG